jgi:hypothetical protein
MKEVIKTRRTGAMPKFIIHFWDVRKGKLEDRGHDVSSKGLSRRFAKHYWEGRIEHAQSGEFRIFHSISEMLLFMEERRID